MGAGPEPTYEEEMRAPPPPPGATGLSSVCDCGIS